ncbi:MAG: succinate dehydrogenase, hydrophobic membrane anchor protein, partial [Usitatibacter sp.]
MSRYAKSPVGAHYGVGDWLLQRLTAVVMAAYTIFFVACLLADPPAAYAQWKAMFSGTLFRLATMLFVGALLYHAWVGMRDILMDY